MGGAGEVGSSEREASAKAAGGLGGGERDTGVWIGRTIFLVALGLRFFRLDFESFWVDEGFTTRCARVPLEMLWDCVHRFEASPPLYFLTQKVWVDLLGPSDWAYRALPALASALMALWVFRLGRRLGGLAPGVIAGLVAALSPYQIFYGQEARPYAFLGLFSAMSFHFYGGLFTRNDRRGRLAYLGSLVLALYTHYHAVLLLVGQGVGLLLEHRRERWRRPRPGVLAAGPNGTEAEGPPLLAVARLQGLALLAALPLLPGLLDQSSRPMVDWVPRPDVAALVRAPLQLYVHGYEGVSGDVEWSGWIALAVLLAGGALALASAAERRAPPEGSPVTQSGAPDPVLLAMAGAVLPMLAFWVVSASGGKQLFYPRYLIGVTPPLYVLAGTLLARVPHPRARIVLTAVALSLPLAKLAGFYGDRTKANWRAAAGYIKEARTRGEHAADEEIIGVGMDVARSVLVHYLQGERPPRFVPAYDVLGTGVLGRYDRVFVAVPYSRPEEIQLARRAAEERYRLTRVVLNRDGRLVFYDLTRMP